uniref:Uncharacterized protein n=1 Tax=Anopheles farauti TaxID=69004 RepID=A0A182Q3H3_9DIPT
MVLELDVLGQPAADDGNARIQPERLLHARLEVAHFAHHLVDLLHDALLDGRVRPEQEQRPSDRGRGRIVPAEDERIHLFADVRIGEHPATVRRLYQQVEKGELLPLGRLLLAGVAIVVDIGRSVRLPLNHGPPLGDHAVRELVKDVETLLLLPVLVRAAEDDVRMEPQLLQPVQHDLTDSSGKKSRTQSKPAALSTSRASLSASTADCLLNTSTKSDSMRKWKVGLCNPHRTSASQQPTLPSLSALMSSALPMTGSVAGPGMPLMCRTSRRYRSRYAARQHTTKMKPSSSSTPPFGTLSIPMEAVSTDSPYAMLPPHTSSRTRTKTAPASHEITQQLDVLAPVDRLDAELPQHGRDDRLLLEDGELLPDAVARPGTERDVRVRVAPVAVLRQEVVRVELVRVGEDGRVPVQLVHDDHGGGTGRDGVVVDAHILGETPPDHWDARVEPQALLDAALEVAHLVQLRHRWPAVPIAAHHAVDLLDDALLDGGCGTQQVQDPGHGRRRRVVPTDDERIDLLADRQIRQAGTFQQEIEKGELLPPVHTVRVGRLRGGGVVVLVQLLLALPELLLAFAHDPVGEGVQHLQTLLVLVELLRALEDKVRM